MTLRSLEVNHRQFSPMVGFDNIFFQILPKAMGWPLYVLGLLGILTLWVPASRFEPQPLRRPVALLLISFPLLFLLVLCQFRLVNAKYLIPILPFWYLFGALFLSRAVAWLRQIPQTVQVPVFATGLLLLAWPLLENSLGYVLVHRQADTRTLARHYLETQIPLGTHVLTEPETVPLASWTPVLGQMMVVRHTLQQGHPVFTVAAQGESIEPLASLPQPAYVLVMLKPIKDPSGRKVLPHPSAYYQTLHDHYRIKAVFSPYPVKVPLSTLSNQPDFMAIYSLLKPKKAKAKRPGPLMLLLEAQSARTAFPG
jgi:hypothetical protein